jgi:hypothetical protein
VGFVLASLIDVATRTHISSIFYFLKAYIEQLESSRAKLARLEQELQRARQQVYSRGKEM